MLQELTTTKWEGREDDASCFEKKKTNLFFSLLIEVLGLGQKAHTSCILTGSLLARELLMASYGILNI